MPPTPGGGVATVAGVGLWRQLFRYGGGLPGAPGQGDLWLYRPRLCKVAEGHQDAAGPMHYLDQGMRRACGTERPGVFPRLSSTAVPLCMSPVSTLLLPARALPSGIRNPSGVPKGISSHQCVRRACGTERLQRLCASTLLHLCSPPIFYPRPFSPTPLRSASVSLRCPLRY